jgi:hypothetical protein
VRRALGAGQKALLARMFALSEDPFINARLPAHLQFSCMPDEPATSLMRRRALSKADRSTGVFALV